MRWCQGRHGVDADPCKAHETFCSLIFLLLPPPLALSKLLQFQPYLNSSRNLPFGSELSWVQGHPSSLPCAATTGSVIPNPISISPPDNPGPLMPCLPWQGTQGRAQPVIYNTLNCQIQHLGASNEGKHSRDLPKP